VIDSSWRGFYHLAHEEHFHSNPLAEPLVRVEWALSVLLIKNNLVTTRW